MGNHGVQPSDWTHGAAMPHDAGLRGLADGEKKDRGWCMLACPLFALVPGPGTGLGVVHTGLPPARPGCAKGVAVHSSSKCLMVRFCTGHRHACCAHFTLRSGHGPMRCTLQACCQFIPSSSMTANYFPAAAHCTPNPATNHKACATHAARTRPSLHTGDQTTKHT